MPAGTECRKATNTVGIPASSPPTSGRKSTSATQIASTAGERDPEHGERYVDDDPCDHGGGEVPEHVAGHGL